VLIGLLVPKPQPPQQSGSFTGIGLDRIAAVQHAQVVADHDLSRLETVVQAQEVGIDVALDQRLQTGPRPCLGVHEIGAEADSPAAGSARCEEGTAHRHERAAAEVDEARTRGQIEEIGSFLRQAKEQLAPVDEEIEAAPGRGANALQQEHGRRHDPPHLPVDRTETIEIGAVGVGAERLGRAGDIAVERDVLRRVALRRHPSDAVGVGFRVVLWRAQ